MVLEGMRLTINFYDQEIHLSIVIFKGLQPPASAIRSLNKGDDQGPKPLVFRLQSVNRTALSDWGHEGQVGCKNIAAVLRTKTELLKEQLTLPKNRTSKTVTNFGSTKTFSPFHLDKCNKLIAKRQIWIFLIGVFLRGIS